MRQARCKYPGGLRCSRSTPRARPDQAIGRYQYPAAELRGAQHLQNQSIDGESAAGFPQRFALGAVGVLSGGNGRRIQPVLYLQSRTAERVRCRRAFDRTLVTQNQAMGGPAHQRNHQQQWRQPVTQVDVEGAGLAAVDLMSVGFKGSEAREPSRVAVGIYNSR